MKIEFKKTAEGNVVASQKFLGDFYDGSWKLLHTSSKLIDNCLKVRGIADDIKIYSLLIMLRNCLSDICCCLDSLERGHDRTVSNNLRMIFEDFSCAIHIFHDDEVYEKFINGKHSASNSIGPAKDLCPNDKKFKLLYGELSKISHHKDHKLLARQMVSREGLLSHLKPIDANRLHIQINPLLIILDFIRSIGEFAEFMCLPFLSNPYFWVQESGKYQRNLKTVEDILLMGLLAKANNILHPASLSGV